MSWRDEEEMLNEALRELDRVDDFKECGLRELTIDSWYASQSEPMYPHPASRLYEKMTERDLEEALIPLDDDDLF